MFSSVRARLTLWYTGVLALVLAVFAGATYLFLVHTLSSRTDASLAEMSRAFDETLRAERQEMREGVDEPDDAPGAGGIHPADAAIVEAASEYHFRDYQLVVYDGARQLVAASSEFASGREEAGAPVWTLPAVSSGLARMIDALAGQPEAESVYATVSDGEHEFRAIGRVLRADGRSYTLFVLRPLEEQHKLLEGVGGALLVGVPLALLLASLGGYFLARRSLAPVAAMSETAERIGAANLHERLPVADERDELGRLARAFNGLLARLADSFEQQRRFMADASHELRTPVAIVRGEAEVSLSRDERSAEEYRESLAVVHDEGRRLTRIVEDLFTLARADAAGQHPLRLTDFYLDEAVADCVRAVRTLAAKRALSLDYEAAPAELPFRGDEELIRQMLLNLLDNAIKYTPTGGRVSVRCETRVAQYLVTVSDTGAGIPAEMQSQVFERFYRADKARSRAEVPEGAGASGSGAGLGLAIARLVAEAHGGRLELLRSDERGSVFVAALPASDAGRE